MVQRLHLSIEVTEKPGGEFVARCPELLLEVSGRSSDEVVDKLKELVFSSMSGGFDSLSMGNKSVDMLYSVLADNRHCYLHFPSEMQVH
ncbi:MAG: hypothetical protein P8123_05075 [bacterium]|jgi:hypothetical protein